MLRAAYQDLHNQKGFSAFLGSDQQSVGLYFTAGPPLQRPGRLADSKSRLQEHTQKLYKRPPHYRVAGTSGPDHEKVFEVEVVIEGKVVAKGRGKNKKEAEQHGADEALKAVEGKKGGGKSA